MAAWVAALLVACFASTGTARPVLKLTSTEIDTGHQAYRLDMAIQSDGSAHVFALTRYDQSQGTALQPMFSWTNESGEWVEPEELFFPTNAYVNKPVSVAVDQQDALHLTFFGGSFPDTYGMYYGFRPSGGSWSFEGRITSRRADGWERITTDSQNRAHIVYKIMGRDEVNHMLRDGEAVEVEVVGVGTEPQIAVDSSDIPHIVAARFTNAANTERDIWYSVQTPDGWTHEPIYEDLEDSADNYANYASVIVSDQDVVYIAYSIRLGDEYRLYLSHVENDTRVHELVADGDLNKGPIQRFYLALGSDGEPIILYATLRERTCGSGKYGDPYVAKKIAGAWRSYHVFHPRSSSDCLAYPQARIRTNEESMYIVFRETVGGAGLPKILTFLEGDMTDLDGDGIEHVFDNCPDAHNADQADSDDDGVGDVCDNCPTNSNAEQFDNDGDAIGNVCDSCRDDPDNDADNDSICGDQDPCPNDPDNDADNDGICGDVDSCPAHANPNETDSDGDNIPDACDNCLDVQNGDQVDTDGDTIGDVCDNCPTSPNTNQANADGDPLGDACDTCPDDVDNDTDNDTVCDGVDNCPANPNTDQTNIDGDPMGDVCDACPNDLENDADNDTICGDVDNCPANPNTDQDDADRDGAGDACDPCPRDENDDEDGDDICADVDNCPTLPNPDQADQNGDDFGDACVDPQGVIRDWVAYNDMSPLDGGANGPDVTTWTYEDVAANLQDYQAGVPLPVTMTGSSVGYDPTVNGAGCDWTTDCYKVFDGKVDLTGVYEIDEADWQYVVTFDDLDPTKTYAVTLTANRDNRGYRDARYTKVSIEGADTLTNASSEGTVIYSESTVSLGTGYNSRNGYVVRWSDITAADGSFSIISTWDMALGLGNRNNKAYAMAAFKLEQFTLPEIPEIPEEVCLNNGDCDDGDPCTDDICDVETGECSQAFNVAPCDDGVACSDNDICENGTCVGVPNCREGELCNVETGVCEEWFVVAFAAYNDLAWAGGQLAHNITTFTSPNGGSGLPSSGELLNFADGLPTGVNLTVTGGTYNGSKYDHGAYGNPPPEGSDGHDIFDGIVTTEGAISYVARRGSPLVLSFDGLDPQFTYTLAYHGDRGSYGWARSSYVTLDGADSFVNESSDANDNPSPESGGALFSGPADPVTRLPSDNALGYVARFTKVVPGPDGAVSLVIDADSAAGYRGKYGSAVMIQATTYGDPECVESGDCDDNDACTDDLCRFGLCEHALNTAPCDDGAGCTDDDVCAQGECAGIDVCPDGQICDLLADQCIGDPTPLWIAYNDMNSAVFPGVNVTAHDYLAQDASLVDFVTGDTLTAHVTGSVVGGYDPTANGWNTFDGTDANLAFGGIIDLIGVHELDTALTQNRMTFSGLDPNRSYTITLTANRARYPNARYTRVSIEGADAYTNASSEGVIVNSEFSVSFCTGDNTENGYVARWTDVTSAAGTFSVLSEWDDGQGSGRSNTKGYAMAAFMLEEHR